MPLAKHTILGTVWKGTTQSVTLRKGDHRGPSQRLGITQVCILLQRVLIKTVV